jgi:preprotein translocase subunit SecA
MNALKANFVFKNGVEYTVRDNEIVLIDQFTGRIMPGRAYSDGLQQALQAKEGVRIEEETQTVATITYQNFYRLYAKISGMTGTAKQRKKSSLKFITLVLLSVQPTCRLFGLTNQTILLQPNKRLWKKWWLILKSSTKLDVLF